MSKIFITDKADMLDFLSLFARDIEFVFADENRTGNTSTLTLEYKINNDGYGTIEITKNGKP